MLDDSLPLFLIQTDALVVYVVDNQLIGCHPMHSHDYYGVARSLNFLLDLFSHSATFKVFPAKLRHHFQDAAPYPFHEIFDFIIGADGYYDWPYLDFQLTIDPSRPKPVSLHSFTLKETSLPYQVFLTPKEAFLIFANHCVNSRFDALSFDPDTKRIECNKHFDLELEKAVMLRTFTSLNSNAILSPKQIAQERENAYCGFYGKKALHAMNQFALDYLKLMKKSFISEEISLPLLLRLNGAGVITFFRSLPVVQHYLEDIFTKLLHSYSSLSFNQKIMYHTLNLLQGNYWFLDHPSKVIQDFFVEKESIFTKLKQDIVRDFPP